MHHFYPSKIFLLQNASFVLLVKQKILNFFFPKEAEKDILQFLVRAFHDFRNEEVAKADGARQAKKLDDGCMYPYCPSPNSSLTQHPSGFPASAVERTRMFGLKSEATFKTKKTMPHSAPPPPERGSSACSVKRPPGLLQELEKFKESQNTPQKKEGQHEAARQGIPVYALKGLPQSYVESLYVAGCNAFVQQDYLEARDFFQMAAYYDRYDQRCWMGFADALSALKQYDQVVQVYNIAAKIAPEDPLPSVALAHWYMAFGKFSQAREKVQEMLGRVEDNPFYMDMESNIYAINKVIDQYEKNWSTNFPASPLEKTTKSFLKISPNKKPLNQKMLDWKEVPYLLLGLTLQKIDSIYNFACQLYEHGNFLEALNKFAVVVIYNPSHEGAKDGVAKSLAALHEKAT